MTHIKELIETGAGKPKMLTSRNRQATEKSTSDTTKMHVIPIMTRPTGYYHSCSGNLMHQRVSATQGHSHRVKLLNSKEKKNVEKTFYQ